jgi:serine/threonine protein kinase
MAGVNKTTLITNQPHIACLLSSDETSLSIILRYETGRSLDTFVDEDLISTIPLQSCFQIFMQIAEALSFIHARRTIHDDIKPDNIMWSPDDRRTVLIDFGAALSESKYSESGTPPYAAPEYLARIKTYKSDVWACGVSMAFVFGYFPLPSGDWLLPNTLLGDTKDRREMDEWLCFVKSITEHTIDRQEPLLGRMLRVCPDARISSEELHERLSLQMHSQLR